MAIVSGTNQRFYMGGSAVACATSDVLQFEAQTRQATNKDSGGFGKAIVDIINVSGNGSAIMDTSATYGVEDLWTALTAKTEITITYTTGTSTEVVWTVTGVITSLTITSNLSENTTFDYSWEGTGVPTMADNP